MSDVSAALRRLVRRSLRSFGVDVRRVDRRANLVDDDRRYLWITRLGCRTVLDVGANDGQFSRWIHALLPGAAVYAFEPLASCQAALVEALRPIARARAFKVALGAEEGEVELHRCVYTPSSSLLPMSGHHRRAFPYTAAQSRETVRVRRLDAVVAELEAELGPLVEPILVKLDVQGFEDRVIQGGSAVLARTAALIIEMSVEPLYEGQTLFPALYARLTELGFAYHGNLEQLLDPDDGRILQVDAVFLRAWRPAGRS